MQEFCTLASVMHFRAYCNSIANIMEARLSGYEHDDLNSADKGELCEIFIREFLQDALGDNFRIFRGGKIINCGGEKSKQMDIVVCSKRAIKFFADKGKYPMEIVKGVFSVTSTLNLPKLDASLEELASIPKTGYHFDMPKDLFPESFRIQTQQIFENVTPVCCIFAYSGNIQASWVDYLNKWIETNRPHHSLTPSLIIVNKKGLIFRRVEKTGENRLKFSFHYIDFAETKNPGDAFSRILNELYSLINEDLYMTPAYTYYFNSDLDW